MNIEIVEKADHLKLLAIWESSVRATHDFLTEEDLQALKPLILEQYFDSVDLRCAKNSNGEILVFCGVHDGDYRDTHNKKCKIERKLTLII